MTISAGVSLSKYVEMGPCAAEILTWVNRARGTSSASHLNLKACEESLSAQDSSRLRHFVSLATLREQQGSKRRLTGATLPDLLDSVLLTVRRNLWFQHDGVPVHFSVDARAQLTVDYGEHWIRRKGPVAWPARSPDLTFLDFFLWECVKSMVYVTRAATRAHLIDRINAAFDNVKQNPATLDRVGRSLLRLYEACNEAQGRLFEHYSHTGARYPVASQKSPPSSHRGCSIYQPPKALDGQRQIGLHDWLYATRH
ncbi:hypothetical protein ANN_03375 [Periplaneta americana]|uniref:Uncharacterized protein n=1 Tax=Periplaneta americana TaxID=6978 RepID=A0ABQ8U0M9_PERAM|nr:hypothetical protein ANN_03375 [Periplaneta americana]